MRNGSDAYFRLIGFLVIFLGIVAPPVEGVRSRRVRFVFFTELCWINITQLLRDTLTASHRL